MNADDHAAYLDRSIAYTYDPRDRVTSLTKTDTSTGTPTDTESYAYDANNNVTSQTLDGTTTDFGYDRNRLVSAASNGATATFNYDPFGRLQSVTSAGEQVEHDVYDGFDRRTEHTELDDAGAPTTTRYTYDPLDRTTSTTTHADASNQETTDYAYLGLSNQLLSESVAGSTTKTYQYGPDGERLSQTTIDADGTTNDTYYGYDPHSDVETLTDANGNTSATYGYTAYGKDDTDQFTGADKPDPQNPDKQPYNAYRFNATRYDPGSGTYDMGFRDYDPGLNRFLARDSYNGALADQHLSTSPWTNNRYAFTGGNPITGIELDGHEFIEGIEVGGSPGLNVGGAVESEFGAGETVVEDGELTAEGKRLSEEWEKGLKARDSEAGRAAERASTEPLSPKDARLTENTRDPAQAVRQQQREASRYQEPTKDASPANSKSRPTYENPGHHDPTGGDNAYIPKKAVLPADAEEHFSHSIEVNGSRYAKIGSGKRAVYYRYFQHGDNVWHWSGSTNGVTKSGESVPIPLDRIPIEVRRS